MCDTVNYDYVTVIRHDGESLKVDKIQICKEVAVINNLKAMAQNENCTVMDLQSLMNRTFAEKERHMSAWHGYGYNSYDVRPVSYPVIRTQDSYEKELNEVMEKYKNYSADYVQRELVSYNEKIKTQYLFAALRFIDMINYRRTVEKISMDPTVIMYSHEISGWCSRDFQLSSDLEAKVYTNFGFGQSSFFTVTLAYKGINLLTFSDIVTYYYANRRDILNYTRRYSEERANWDVAFAFLTDVANKSKAGVNNFVKEWVMKEVSTLVTGLAQILESPDAYVTRFAKSFNPKDGSRYVTVRPMGTADIDLYSCYPHELANAFQAEKISAGVEMLEKLTEISAEFHEIDDYIFRVRQIAKRAIPRINRNIETAMADIEAIRREAEHVESMCAETKEALRPHNEAIEKIRESESYKAEDVALYESNHPEYNILRNKYYELQEELYKKNLDISRREHFLDTLKDSIAIIVAGIESNAA